VTSEEDAKKAAGFFQHAKVKGDIAQYEYAISMYIDGLSLDPDNGDMHQALRSLSLKRKVSGGKDLGFFDKGSLKRPTKDDKQNMLNAEKLLAYNPGETDLMINFMQNAHRAGCWDTAVWLAPIALKANADSPNPNFQRFIVVKDIMVSLEQWKIAVDACHYAAQLRPQDMDLQTELKNLGAQLTMSQGNYGTSKSFRDSVRDASGQDKLMRKDKDFQSEDQMSMHIREMEEEWNRDPEELSKITKYVEALEKMETIEYENRALEVLETAFEKSKAFRFRMHMGRIQMKQMTRQHRSMLQQLKESPNDEELKKDVRDVFLQRVQFELDEYTLWADNYPTETRYRFEICLRLFELKRFDDAIPILQHVRNDPKFKPLATVVLGRAFLESGFVDEADETLAGLINEYQVRGDEKSLEMYYWRARALEQKNDLDGAIKHLSQVAQWDFQYKDVQKRIKELRARKSGQ